MKKISSIIFLVLLIHTLNLFSQNKKNNLSPPQIQNLPPTADFSWLNSCLGDTTCFVNQTIRGNTYTWTIVGDTLGPHNTIYPDTLYQTKHGSDTNICFNFSTPGSYTVSLTAYNNHYNTSTKVITIDTITKAAFSFIPCSNQFVNTSLCATSYYWDFGDGTNSILSLPIHQYNDTGNYMVTLIAYNGFKSDTMKQQLHIAVESRPNGNFTYIISHDTVFFHALYTSNASSTYNWAFGDAGGYASGKDTIHVYKDSTAIYGVTLVVINGCGPAYGEDSIHITQQPPPIPAFSYIKTCLGDTTCFINQTVGGNTYTWTVSDTGAAATPLFSSTNSNICFRFPQSGTYQVTLTTNNSFYTKSITKMVAIGTVPLADFSFIPCSNNFSNRSSCANSFYWDFGDATNSTQVLPYHEYADTGFYQVTLKAYNAGDSSILTQQIHVTTLSSPNANFSAIINNDTLWVHANYTGTPLPLYYWTFGDGTHATGRDTVHVYYDTTWFYNVRLSVTNPCGNAFKTDTIKTVYYNNRPPAGLSFSNSILAIVPNPVSNNTYVNAFFNSYTDNIYLAQVYNALGQKMFEENFSFQQGVNEFKISTVNFFSGVYVLVLQAGNSYIRQRFYVITKS